MYSAAVLVPTGQKKVDTTRWFQHRVHMNSARSAGFRPPFTNEATSEPWRRQETEVMGLHKQVLPSNLEAPLVTRKRLCAQKTPSTTP